MKSYTDLLKDPRWQRRRLEILSRSDFQCEECGDAESTLHVHHKLYRKAAMPWEYMDCELESLCEDCHKSRHYLRAAISSAMAEMGVHLLHRLLGYAQGMKVMCIGEFPGDGEFPAIEGVSHAAGVFDITEDLIPLPLTFQSNVNQDERKRVLQALNYRRKGR